MPTGVPGAPRILAVVVTFWPDLARLSTLLTAIAPQVESVVVVDNGSSPEVLQAIESYLGGAQGWLLPLKANLGIAAAQNFGVERARHAGATHVLLLDDDSAPAGDMVARLTAALAAPGGERIAAVGPVVRDRRAVGEPLVFTDQQAGPRRAPQLPSADGATIDVAFLIASGTLIDLQAFDAVGPFNEAMFIDHVDLEWGVRARRAGWHLRVVVGAELDHNLGERARRVPWRSREVHVQAPDRNYYMVRNTLWLVRGDLLPTRWRRGYVRWITRYAAFYAVAVPPRPLRLRRMARGVRDGMVGKLGPLPGAGDHQG